MATDIRRGGLFWLDWSPGRGSEQTGRRPALIVQADPGNRNPNYPLTIVAAVSTKGRDEVPTHVLLSPTSGNGLADRSYIKCEQLMTVTKDRILDLIGYLDKHEMEDVDLAMKRALALT